MDALMQLKEVMIHCVETVGRDDLLSAAVAAMEVGGRFVMPVCAGERLVV